MFHDANIPSITRPTARFINDLLAGPTVWSVDGNFDPTLEDGQFTLGINLRTRPTIVEASVCSRIECEFGTFRLIVEQAFVDAMSDLYIPGWQNEHEKLLPLTWRNATTVGCVLNTFFPNRSTFRIGKTVTKGIEDLSKRPNSVGGLVILNNRSFRFRLIIETTSNRNLSSWKSKRTKENPIATQLTYRSKAKLSGVSLPMAVLNNCRVEDVILLNSERQNELAGTVAIHTYGECQGFFQENGQFIIQYFTREDQNMSDENSPHIDTADHRDDLSHDVVLDKNASLESNNEDNEGTNADCEPEEEGAKLETILGTMFVELSFQLSTKRVQLDTIDQYVPGATIDLGIDLSSPLRICANDQVFAYGSLVKIGSKFGVQIDRLLSTPGQTDA